MMPSPLALTERRKQHACEHPDRISTVNFGLERQVCLECGSVRMLRDSVGESGTLFKVPHPISQPES